MEAVFLPRAILARVPFAKFLTWGWACVTIRGPKGRFQKGGLQNVSFLGWVAVPSPKFIVKRTQAPELVRAWVDSAVSVSFLQALDQKPWVHP